jgi:hypothetical protein
MPNPRTASGWRPGPDVHWESWSRNGEVCIGGLNPPFAGGARLASCLTWLLREFASRCRRTHDAAGALALTIKSPRLPSPLAMSMVLSFDLALRDPKLIRERVRRRGGDGAVRRWPAFWLEGAVYEYVIGREPFPPVGTPRRKLLLLAEENQAVVPARPAVALPAGACRVWSNSLDAIASVDGADVRGLLVGDEHAGAAKSFMEKSEGTEAFIAEFDRLVGECVRAAIRRPRSSSGVVPSLMASAASLRWPAAESFSGRGRPSTSDDRRRTQPSRQNLSPWSRTTWRFALFQAALTSRVLDICPSMPRCCTTISFEGATSGGRCRARR